MHLTTRPPQQLRPIERGRHPISSTRAAAPLAAVLAHQDLIGFPLQVIGRSTAPVIPQRVGDWWLEPIRLDAELPPRARRRLDALLALDLVPKAVVLFHEIGVEQAPAARPAVASSPVRAGRQLGAWLRRWAQQSLPVLVDRLSVAARHHGPPLARGAARLAVGTLGLAVLGVGAVTVAALGLTTLAIGAALTDPCLVIVTADGYWIEIDRWDD